MDELEISGKRYISTRRAAREHGYHSDYMGQLIRGKKVVGQKVGRAWYIEEESLNGYLGKTPAAAPALNTAPATVAEVAPAPASVPAPVEPLIVEEPLLQPLQEVAVPQPVVEIAQEIKVVQPVAVRVEPQAVEPVYAQPVVQEIHHAPYIEEQETLIPIHTPAPAPQQMGGLRYAPDDSPSIPVVTRMPQTQAQAYQQTSYAPAKHSTGKFPYIGLSVVGVVAIVVATFASNFISATVISQEGKAATVQYAIHW